MFAANVEGDGIQDILITVIPRNLSLLLQFQKEEDCVGFYFTERQASSKLVPGSQTRR